MAGGGVVNLWRLQVKEIWVERRCDGKMVGWWVRCWDSQGFTKATDFQYRSTEPFKRDPQHPAPELVISHGFWMLWKIISESFFVCDFRVGTNLVSCLLSWLVWSWLQKIAIRKMLKQFRTFPGGNCWSGDRGRVIRPCFQGHRYISFWRNMLPDLPTIFPGV